MSWLHEHAAAVSALVAIFTSLYTLIIIFFNVTQLRLNGRSLNIDINFKVFELRKNLFKQTSAFINSLKQEKGLRQHLIETDNGEFATSEQYKQLREDIDNYKYLFSHEFAVALEFLILNIENGIQTEYRIGKLKNKDASMWNFEDQNEMQSFGYKMKDITDCITSFDLDHFLPYLNVSNFHKDLMHSEGTDTRNKLATFNNTILLVKKGAAFIPKLINRQKII